MAASPIPAAQLVCPHRRPVPIDALPFTAGACALATAAAAAATLKVKLDSDDLTNEVNKLMDEVNTLSIEREMLKRAQDSYVRCMRSAAKRALN